MHRSLTYDIAADLDTPVSAYIKLRPLRPRFLLESVEQGLRVARYSFIGLGDCQEIRVDSRGLSIDGRLHCALNGKSELLAATRRRTSAAWRPGRIFIVFTFAVLRTHLASRATGAGDTRGALRRAAVVACL